MTFRGSNKRSLEELDAADRDQVKRAEDTILHLFQYEHPTSTSELSELVRARLGDVDNAIIRAAILRLLDENLIGVESGRVVSAQ
jgi:hypothetical protein